MSIFGAWRKCAAGDLDNDLRMNHQSTIADDRVVIGCETQTNVMAGRNLEVSYRWYTVDDIHVQARCLDCDPIYLDSKL